MATPFREWPWPLQALFYLGLAVLVVVAGLYTPGSPVRNIRTELDAANARMKPLEAEVAALRVYQQRRVELQTEMDALEKQLATLQAIVPEDKQVDQFILMLQGAAASSGVSLRRITTKPIVAREYHYEMPFEVEADGPYFSVLDFFSKLGRLSRIINVGDVKLTGIEQGAAQHPFRLTPGTTVTGTFTVTTFFTKSGEQAPPPGPPAGKKR